MCYGPFLKLIGETVVSMARVFKMLLCDLTRQKHFNFWRLCFVCFLLLLFCYVVLLRFPFLFVQELLQMFTVRTNNTQL